MPKQRWEPVSPPSRGARKRLGVVLAVPLCFFAMLVLSEFLARAPRLAWVGPTANDWPMLVAIVSALWLWRRGVREVAANTHDILPRIVRAGGAGFIVVGELLAGINEMSYGVPWPGHRIASVGVALAVAGTLVLLYRGYWVWRVRLGKVDGWAVRSLGAEECPGHLKPWMLGGCQAPYHVLVRLREARSAYRGSDGEVLIALLPNS